MKLGQKLLKSLVLLASLGCAGGAKAKAENF
jgi:hypothetical protein